jgi:hypothetical protein
MERGLEDEMKKFLFKRTYESVLVKEEETYSLLDAVIDYGAEKIAEENPLLAAMFLFKLCTMSRDDLGLILADDMVVYPAGGERTVIDCKGETLEKIFNISGGVMSFYGSGIIPKDLKTKINFKGIGGTPFYGSSPEKSDLAYYDDGFKGHISIEDGKVSYTLGLAEDAEHEVSGPSRWIMNLLFGAVDPSEIKEKGVRECVEYMDKILYKIITMIQDGYPQYIILQDEWVSRIKEEWNSNEEKMEELKAHDAVVPVDIINSPPPRPSAPGTMTEDVLAKLDPAVQRGLVDEGKIRILLQWKDGKLDIKFLKPEEEVSSTFKITLDYEAMTRMTAGEISFLNLYKSSDLRIAGSGENVLSIFVGLAHLMHHIFDGTLAAIVRRSIKE